MTTTDRSTTSTHAGPHLSATRSGNARNERRLGLAMVFPFFFLFLVVLIIPIGYALYLSFFTERSSGLGFGAAEQLFVGFGNYVDVLADTAFQVGFANVAIYAVIAFPVGMIIAVALALLLDAGLAWGRRVLTTTLFIPHAVPGLIATIVWIYLYTPRVSPIYEFLQDLGASVDFFGMPEAFVSMANIAWWGGIGYNVIIFYAALQAIDREVVEAAVVDGAGRVRTALWIKLPYLRSTIVFLALFGAVGMDAGLHRAAADQRVRAGRQLGVGAGDVHLQQGLRGLGLRDGRCRFHPPGPRRRRSLLRRHPGRQPLEDGMSTTLVAERATRAGGSATGSTPRQRPTRRPSKRRDVPSRIGVTLIFVIVAAYMIMPLVWMTLSVTKAPGQLFTDTGFVFGSLADLRANMVNLFEQEDGVFLLWIRNTVIYAGVGGVGATVISLMAGYAFDKLTFPLKEKLFAFVLVGILVPSTVISLPMYLLAAQVNIINTMWAVLIPCLINPFGVYLARVFSEGYIDRSLIEAARMDGASEFRILGAIAFPLLKPGAVTIFLLIFSGIWNSFFLSLIMLSNHDLFPLGVGLYNWNLDSRVTPEYYSLVLAGAFIAVVPLIIAFVFLQRYWRAGMTAGAVK